MRLQVFVAAIVCLCSSHAELQEEFEDVHKPYDMDTLIKIEPQKAIHLTIVKDLLKDPKLDFWTQRIVANEAVVVRVPDERYSYVMALLRKHRVPFTVIDDDLQEQVDKEWMRLQKRFNKLKPGQQAFNISDFNTYDDIMSWLEEMKGKCASGVTCTTYSIGQSVEGRDIKALKISTGSGKKGYWIDGGIHAREWISPATVLKITNHLIADYATDATVKRLVDGYDWYILPMLNPDGYIFSWSDSRYWRKNRRVNDNGCFGVDLNRNYDMKWMNDGTSSDPCSDTYGGPSAASEPETVAVQDELKRLAPNLNGMLTVHSYAEVYIFPFGHTDDFGDCARAPDHDDMMNVANQVADAIGNTFDGYWRRGTSCEVLYASSGATDDYAKGVANIKYAATLELRGPDFVVPPSAIQPSYEEVWNGVVAFADSTSGS